ncbi:MAG: hypothetical protein FJW40_06555 [Acidobacteria bacterium]|nr:hypothetical protein [Acidobacteriota bacterium]
MNAARVALAAIGLAAVCLALNRPMFEDLEYPYRDSIEGGYAGTTRLVAGHPNPWGWNPLQYGGLPVQFTYLPGLPYTAAAVAGLTGIEPGYAYRLVSSFLAVLAPVSLLLLLVRVTGNLAPALAGGAALALFSPSYGLFTMIQKDAGVFYLPWRLKVLVKYGEGPHNAGLALLPLAMLAVWSAAERGGARWRIPVASVAMAAVTLTNWVAGLALAAVVLLTLLAGAGRRDFSFGRVLGASVLAYLMAAFWLTPEFVKTTLLNWPRDAFDYKVEENHRLQWLSLVAVLVAVRWLFRRMGDNLALCVTTLTAIAFGWIAIGYYSWQSDLLPESRRYVLEFEFFLVAALAAWMWLGWRSSNGVHRFCAVAPLAMMLMSGAGQGIRYATQGPAAWRMIPARETIEYRVSEWLDGAKPQGRVFASGGLRFRLNAHFDLAQVGGTFESGLRNRASLGYAYQVRTDLGSTAESRAADSLRQLTVLGAEYVVVHGAQSEEYYRDFKNPGKFEGHLPDAFRDGDDTIYRVPFRGLAHWVREDELPKQEGLAQLGPLYGAMTDTARPLPRLRWEGNNRMIVEGDAPAGMSLFVLVSHDEGWRARQSGQAVALNGTATGFLKAAAKAGAGPVVLEFEPSAQQMGCAAVSAAAWMGGISLCLTGRRRLRG